jgi:lipoyl(octanoyl) transferase
MNIEWKISEKPVDFEFAFAEMEKRVNQIITNQAEQLIWILEHPPVYTAGISAKSSDLIRNVPLIKTNRGGKITYHGPGIKIVYVLLDLKKFFSDSPPSVSEFVIFLENWIITILADLGIKSFTAPGRIGVWTNQNGSEKKIASLGIKLRKWISYHGFALNINCDLSAFNAIIPCGIKEFGVTSVEGILGDTVDDKKIYKLIREKFYHTLESFLSQKNPLSSS